MKVDDDFPFQKLECQYFDVCNDYSPGHCGYSDKCDKRGMLREHLEPYFPRANLEMQVTLIMQDRGRK